MKRARRRWMGDEKSRKDIVYLLQRGGFHFGWLGLDWTGPVKTFYWDRLDWCSFVGSDV